MTARADYDRANDLASRARAILAEWRALMVAAQDDALVPAYRALEEAQLALDDAANRLHAAVRVEPTDADRDRVVAEVRDVLDWAPERKPAPGWVSRHNGLLLGVAGHLAQVSPHDPICGWAVWQMNHDSLGGWMMIASGTENGEAAQLAAEDALRAIAEKILRAVGK